jgi:hypothetical protein
MSVAASRQSAAIILARPQEYCAALSRDAATYGGVAEHSLHFQSAAISEIRSNRNLVAAACCCGQECPRAAGVVQLRMSGSTVVQISA